MLVGFQSPFFEEDARPITSHENSGAPTFYNFGGSNEGCQTTPTASKIIQTHEGKQVDSNVSNGEIQ
jgi:hypothetical protein